MRLSEGGMWDVGKCHQDKYLSSTEVYRGGRWVTVGPLPMAVDGVRGVTLDNTVFMTGQMVSYLHTHIVRRVSTGGQDNQPTHRPEIWRYSAESGSWSLDIYMRTERSFHAVSVVNYHDYCG